MSEKVGFVGLGIMERAEEFVASPWFDRPGVVREITLEAFIRAGGEPVAISKEHDLAEFFYMLDPKPVTGGRAPRT